MRFGSKVLEFENGGLEEGFTGWMEMILGWSEISAGRGGNRFGITGKRFGIPVKGFAIPRKGFGLEGNEFGDCRKPFWAGWKWVWVGGNSRVELIFNTLKKNCGFLNKLISLIQWMNDLFTEV